MLSKKFLISVFICIIGISFISIVPSPAGGCTSTYYVHNVVGICDFYPTRHDCYNSHCAVIPTVLDEGVCHVEGPGGDFCEDFGSIRGDDFAKGGSQCPDIKTYMEIESKWSWYEGTRCLIKQGSLCEFSSGWEYWDADDNRCVECSPSINGIVARECGNVNAVSYACDLSLSQPQTICEEACGADTWCDEMEVDMDRPDICGAYHLAVNLRCDQFCRVSGTMYTCDATTHNECQTVTCGGTTYYCTQNAGTWQWRTFSNPDRCGGNSDGCYPYGNGCEIRDYYCSSGSCTYSYSNRHSGSNYMCSYGKCTAGGGGGGWWRPPRMLGLTEGDIMIIIAAIVIIVIIFAALKFLVKKK